MVHNACFVVCIIVCVVSLNACVYARHVMAVHSQRHHSYVLSAIAYVVDVNMACYSSSRCVFVCVYVIVYVIYARRYLSMVVTVTSGAALTDFACTQSTSHLYIHTICTYLILLRT